ncbi:MULTISPECIES: CsbD family protein [Ralstonia]|uniref:CsbD family protein n=1 Tax=Ralstonia TaxID=48736 RepID=UPI00076E4C0C|nr:MULTISPECIES: CsbD family protein [Ralstonia]GAQ31249.1 hypothetical protein SAMD00023378_4932 [Ralstonia sp. NT80]
MDPARADTAGRFSVAIGQAYFCDIPVCPTGLSDNVAWARKPHAVSCNGGIAPLVNAGGRPLHRPTNRGIDTMNKDQVKGRLQEAKGKIKEVAGKVTGDEKTQLKGNIEKNIGKARATMGDVREEVKKTLDR